MKSSCWQISLEARIQRAKGCSKYWVSPEVASGTGQRASLCHSTGTPCTPIQGTECSFDLHFLGEAQQFLRKCRQRQVSNGLQQLPQKAGSPQFGGTKDTGKNVVDNQNAELFLYNPEV